MEGNEIKYMLNDVVDVYVKDLSDDNKYVQFYFINTRRKIAISAPAVVMDLIKSFSNGVSLQMITAVYSVEYFGQELGEFLNFLIINQIIVPDLDQVLAPSFFEKEALFVHEWVGKKQIIWPMNKKILIVGCGSVGGAIAEILIRGGVSHIGLLDFKVLSEPDRVRHVHYDSRMIGLHKTEALERYLVSIRDDIFISKHDLKITPYTKMENILEYNYDFIVNTADEPYIGYTSILLGRWAREIQIPLYVAGGFDAHLFSTGDFYDTSQGDCVECAADFFSISLKDWKPTYFVSERQSSEASLGEHVILGGAGGHLAGTLFTASYAAMNILNFLHGGTQWRHSRHRRGEYDNLSGLLNWIEISTGLKCTHHE